MAHSIYTQQLYKWDNVLIHLVALFVPFDVIIK